MSNYQLQTLPDVEGAARDYLRAAPSVSAIAGNRGFFGLPPNCIFPAYTVAQVGGGPDFGGLPISAALLQIDCWGEGRNKAQAAELQLAIVNLFQSIQSGTPMGSNAEAVWASVLSVIWLPDPESDQARYVITAELAARAS